MSIEADSSAITRVRPRPRRARIVLGMMLAFAVAVLCVVAIVPYSLYRNVGDVDVDLGSLPDRPLETVPGAVDVAVVGVMEERCVSLMLFHIDADRAGASFVSIPGSAVCGPGATALGPGDPQTVAQNLERISGVRLDSMAVLDWHAIAQLDERAGGVEVALDGAAYQPYPNTYLTIRSEDVASFAGALVSSTGEEEVRIRRQQLLMQEVLRATLHQEMRKDPLELYSFLDIVTNNLDLDTGSSIELSRLVVSLRNMRSGHISFHTAPLPDGGDAADSLWAAVREDRIDAG